MAPGRDGAAVGSWAPGATVQPAPGDGADRRTVAVLATIVVLGLALRIPGLGESLWFDELFSTRLHLYSAGALFRTAARDLHPPFHSLLMFVWIRLFGDSEVAVRIPALLFGLGSILLTYAVARRFTSGRAAVLAAFLMALSPVHIWYSQEARLYAAGVFFTLLAVYALHRVIERPDSDRLVWGYAGAVGLLAMTHFYHVSIIGALAAVALLRGGPRMRSLVRIDVAIILALGAYIVVKTEVGGLTTDSGHLIAFTPAALWRLFFDWFLTGGTLWLAPAWQTGAGALLRIGTGIAALVMLGLGARNLAADGGRAKLEPVLYLLALPALLLAMNVAGFGRVYIERSMLPALPFFVLLLATGLNAIADRGGGAVIAAIIVLATVPVAGLFRHRDEWTVYKPNPDWRSAAAHLQAYQDDREPLIVFAATPASALNYYGLDLSEREATLADVVGT
ncbi:MAG: glycosyltransferase family 39 protein, partial [Longimicrobiales bacterium]